MDTRPITPARLAESVIAVPPLARDSSLEIHPEQNRRIVEYLEAGGITTLLYGGNAVLYHVRPSEYEQLLHMLTEIVKPDTLVVPSVGPAFGMMMDQAAVLQDFDFPTVMILPQRDVCDAPGTATGIRRFADAFGKPVVLYLKHDQWLPSRLVEKLYADGLLSWIKYAVVRDDPAEDDYLREILHVVPSDIVVSGIGEQPAIVHLRDFEVQSFTSGCVCINPALSMEMLRAVQAGEFERAERLRLQFQPLEDLRNEISPIRVLHRAVELAGIAETGPMLPLLGELAPEQLTRIANAACALREIPTVSG
ncbi:MAG: dihydrodipicolinate synthase family protein [Pirellulaceae bacterium]|nr:MAG: dihydrodipicolinate synthase family protein [Pirellulaceae bacterium]